MNATKRASLRASFFRPSVVLTEEEQAERAERRKRSVAEVQKALAAKAELIEPRQLHRYGCKMVVCLVWHGRSSTGERKLVVIPDNMKWTAWGKWLETTLGLREGESKGLVVQYFNARGKAVPIDTKWALISWLDNNWTRHPPELHIYSVGAMVDAAEVREEVVRSIFEQYDEDHSGQLSPAEVKEMLRQLQLSSELGVSKEDVGYFVDAQFSAADVNKDGVVSFDEFVQYFNSLQDYLKDQLTTERLHRHVLMHFREEYVEATSHRRSLGQILTRLGGTLALTAQGHNYGIEASFSADCANDANRDLPIRVCTLLEQKLEYFADESKTLDVMLTPPVLVDFDDAVELDDTFTLTLPHCLHEGPDSKEALVVVYATLTSQTWVEVSPEAYELLPPKPSRANGRPCIRVTMLDPGIICAFSRQGVPFEQRLRCFAFLPQRINPLETEHVSIYIAPELPDVLETVQLEEEHDRGLVKIGGRSEVLHVKPGSFIEVTVEQDEKETHAVIWSGEPCCLKYEFDPEQFARSAGGEASIQDGGHRRSLCGSLPVACRVIERSARGSSRRNAVSRRELQHSEFGVDVTVHVFRPPSAPVKPYVYTQTSTALIFRWLQPKDWGGCALAYYQLELREKSTRGLGEWRNLWEGPATRAEAKLALNFHAGEMRVRAYNVGSETPSEWSVVCVIASEQEKAATKIAAVRRGNVSRKSYAASEREREGSVTEGGVAVVTQKDIGEQAGKRHVVDKRMRGWNPFKQAVGAFFLEMGVAGGVSGTLFDLTVGQVEDLVQTTAADGDDDEYDVLLNSDRPLTTLAAAATWVIETLAHHTHDAERWIEYVNAIAGLVQMAAYQPEDETMIPHVRRILHTLFDIYETLRQCEPDGFITRQLKQRYDSNVKELLQREHSAQLESMRNDLATQVMSMELVTRQLGLQRLGNLPGLSGKEAARFSRARSSMSILDSLDALGEDSGISKADEVVLTHVSANLEARAKADNGLNSGRSRRSARGAPQLHVSFTIRGIDGTPTNRTFWAEKKVHSSWRHEVVEVPVPPGAQLPDPLSLSVALYERFEGDDDATCLGVGIVDIGDAVGRVADVAIEPTVTADRDPMAKATSGISVSFTYRVMPWIG